MTSLPEVQAVAREHSEDPVGDVRRARACYLHAAEMAAYTREEAWLLVPPEDVTGRKDAPPEWLRPTVRQIQALKSFSIAGWGQMNRAEAAVAIAHGIRRWQRGLAHYSLVQALVDKGHLSMEAALSCSDSRAKALLAPAWWRQVISRSIS